MGRYRPILFLINLLFCHATMCQSVLRYQINHVSQNEGLSSTYVRKIVQDPYGFIWAGTQDGLNRYDGKRNIIFNKDNRNRHTLSGSDIRDLIIDTLRHSIWVLTSYGGIDGIDYRTATTWFHYDQQRNPAMSDLVFNCFFIFEKTIYIGSTAGFYKLDFITGQSPVLKTAEQAIRLQAETVDKVVVKDQHLAWVFTRSGNIFVMDMALKKIISRAGNDSTAFKTFRTLDACVLQNGEILTATTSGLQTLSLSTNNNIINNSNRFYFLDRVLSNTVFACFQEKSGRVWVSDAKKVLRLDLSTNTYELLRENSSSTNEDWIGSVYSFFIDGKETLWLACHQGLAFANNQVSPFYRMYQSALSTDRMEHIYYIDPKNDSIVYASGQNGLYLLNSRTGTIDNISPGLNYYHSFTDNKGNNIVSNDQGNFILTNRQHIPIARLYSEFSGKQFIFNSHVRLNDSTIALGTRDFNGIVVWVSKTKTLRVISTRSTGGSLAENVVNALYLDKKENLWVLGDHSITVLSNKLDVIKTFTPFNKKNRKSFSLFFDVYDSGSFYYVASYGQGILVLDKQFEITKELTAGIELSSNSTYKLLPYHDSLLFITSNNGLSVIELDGSDKYHSYFENDGLQSNSFEENTGVVFNDRIFAGGSKGLTIIDPALFQNTEKDIPLFIDNIIVNRQNGTLLDTADINLRYFKVPNNATQTTLTFSSPVYLQSSSVEYQYKVNELQQKWIDLGNRNVISFIGLAPGKYTVNIRARYRHEKWPEQYLTIELAFAPKWFQTIIFKLLVLFVLVSGLYFLYRFRIAQIRKQEQIRKDIATDLHDDIGSNLNSIKIFTHLAIKEDKPQEYLANIEDSLTQTTAGLRDMIWILDDSKDTTQELMTRIRRFAHPLCLAKNITLNCVAETGNQEESLTKSEKRNLLLIAKEVINNSIKYANCNKIELKLTSKGKEKKFTIKDNGSGFDTSIMSVGNGLKNISHRAAQLKWQVSIESDKNGTVVTLRN